MESDHHVVVPVMKEATEESEGTHEAMPISPRELPKGMNVPKGIRGVYQMRTAKKNVSRYQVRVWIKRGQITSTPKDEESESPLRVSLGLNKKGESRLHLTLPLSFLFLLTKSFSPLCLSLVLVSYRIASKRNAGRRVHLGCFGSLSTSIRAFDIAEIFFQGKYAATNYPIETYDNSPVLHFLLSTVKDRTNLEEFMTVWKHLMQYRWVFDSTESTPTIQKQLNIIKEKVQKNLQHLLQARVPFTGTSGDITLPVISQNFSAAVPAPISLSPPRDARGTFQSNPLHQSTTNNIINNGSLVMPQQQHPLAHEQNVASLSSFLQVLIKEKEQKALLDTTLALKALNEMQETRSLHLGIQLTKALQQYESLQTFLNQVQTTEKNA